MVNAETARLSALKAKYVTGKLHKETKDNIIVIKMDDVLTPRSPPRSLITRLNVKSGALLETAAGRQAAAASRRQALKAKTLLGLEKGNAKRSLALVRIGKTKAEKKAQIDAKAAKALITLSLEQGKKMAVIEAEHKRVAAFAAKRAALTCEASPRGVRRHIKREAQHLEDFLEPHAVRVDGYRDKSTLWRRATLY